VVVDESLTSGTNYWNASAGCLRFQHLTLTGGAIGFGPCASVGAAVALEWLERETGDDENGNGRYVINIQADGCAAYAPQGSYFPPNTFRLPDRPDYPYTVYSGHITRD
jgi:acetolactate synthase-1/2/3 large subunit|tara:strand:+ start:1500 stop:1826 length:327 start_codon:yes stop_codon:yes gene_type:complete